jgi:hypothetical protein
VADFCSRNYQRWLSILVYIINIDISMASHEYGRNGYNG